MDRFSELVPIECPGCGVKTEQSLRWLFRNPACGQCGSDLTPAVEKSMGSVDDRFPWPQIQDPTDKVLY